MRVLLKDEWQEKNQWHDFVSKLTTEELVYLLYKDHLVYNISKEQEI